MAGAGCAALVVVPATDRFSWPLGLPVLVLVSTLVSVLVGMLVRATGLYADQNGLIWSTGLGPRRAPWERIQDRRVDSDE